MIIFLPINSENLHFYQPYKAAYPVALQPFQSRITPHEYEARIADPTLLRWYYIELDDRKIGSVWLEKNQPQDDIATLGIFIVEEELRGKGIGTAAIHFVLSHAMLQLNVSTVTLNVRADNRRAIHCYNKIGFIEIGRYEAKSGVHAISMQYIK